MNCRRRCQVRPVTNLDHRFHPLAIVDLEAELLDQGLATPFAPGGPGRVMTGWMELSEELAHDPEQLLDWCQRAVEHVSKLPPKVAKGAARPAAKAAGKKTPVKRATRRKA